jgi:hypothetical protein
VNYFFFLSSLLGIGCFFKEVGWLARAPRCRLHTAVADENPDMGDHVIGEIIHRLSLAPVEGEPIVDAQPAENSAPTSSEAHEEFAKQFAQSIYTQAVDAAKRSASANVTAINDGIRVSDVVVEQVPEEESLTWSSGQEIVVKTLEV